VLQRYPEARSALTKKAMEVESAARAQGMQAAPAKASAQMGTMALPLSWDVLVAQGVAQGREVLVVDQSRCTYCNNCMDACERRHGASRLQLRGVQVENLMFPSACRHCEDPVCLLCASTASCGSRAGSHRQRLHRVRGVRGQLPAMAHQHTAGEPAEAVAPRQPAADDRGCRERAAAPAEMDAKVPKKAVNATSRGATTTRA
jgi:NAD-dependent dihydropyrimidine dehydrogenase PreA subunit